MITVVTVSGRLFIQSFALRYRTIVCLCVCLCVCLSVCVHVCVCLVTLVYCGQTVGQIKMPLGTEVGLGPDHTVLDENPAPLK